MHAIVEKSINLIYKTAKPFIDKIGEPFRYKIIETGCHGTCEWRLDNTGHLYIYPKNGVRGMLADSIGFAPNIRWLPYASKIHHLTIEEGVWANQNAAFLFSGLYNCRIIDAEKLNVSNTRNFTCMFDGCKNLKKVDVSGWNTGNVTDMGGMFHGCSKLEWIVGDFKNFDTSKVKNMSGMFFDCHSLELLNLNSFDMKNVWNISNMFAYCTKLRVLLFKNFTEKGISSRCETKDMFKNCRRLKRLFVQPKKGKSFKFEWPEVFNKKSIKLSLKEHLAVPLLRKLRNLKKGPSTAV